MVRREIGEGVLGCYKVHIEKIIRSVKGRQKRPILNEKNKEKAGYLLFPTENYKYYYYYYCKGISIVREEKCHLGGQAQFCRQLSK